MHEAAVADGSQQKREGKVLAQDAGAKIARMDCDGVTRAQCDFFEDTTVLAQRDFAFSTAVEVVEDGARQPAARQGAKVRDADYARRSDGAGGGHGWITMFSS
jgi:hypothetical protein